jgi:hypothetical protein
MLGGRELSDHVSGKPRQRVRLTSASCSPTHDPSGLPGHARAGVAAQIEQLTGPRVERQALVAGGWWLVIIVVSVGAAGTLPNVLVICSGAPIEIDEHADHPQRRGCG